MTGAKSKIALIGLSSDGSEGIEPGIHVRWDFPAKLGFPPEGVHLYRWEVTAVQVLSCFTPGNELPGHTYPVADPAGTSISTGLPRMAWAEASRGGTAVGSVATVALPRSQRTDPAGTTTALALPDRSRLSFEQCAADRVEITYHVRPGTRFRITAHARGFDYEPVLIDGGVSGRREVSIVACGITGLTFEGQNIFIVRICAYCCYRGSRDGWRELTEGQIYRLPVGLDGSVFEPFYNEENGDYMHALARLFAGRTERPMSLESFEELTPLMTQMLEQDGKTVPVGWSVPPEVEASGDPEQGIPALDVSSYDTLRITSLSRLIARVLGMYWLDLTVLPDMLYDYRIVARYPEGHLARLEHQFDFLAYDPSDVLYADLAIGHALFNRLDDPEIVLTASALARADRGLAYRNSSAFTTRILFSQPVCEVQIFLKFAGATLRVRGRRRADPSTMFPFERVYQERECVVHLSAADGIEEVRLEGTGIVVYRLHYDFERLSGLELETTLCGMRLEKGRPVEPPRNLVATLLPSGSTYDPEKVEVSRYSAGLRWNADVESDVRKLAGSAVGFHVYRQHEAGTEEQVTAESPVYISASALEPGARAAHVPAGWPAARQYYVDALRERGEYHYRVSAIDLFGRESAKSNSSAVDITAHVPPPPVNVRAKYLDPATLRDDGTSTDPNLTSDDIAWLDAHRTGGIVAGWSWTPVQAARCEDVDRFLVHFEHGWLNQFKGAVAAGPTEETLPAALLTFGPEDTTRYPVLSGATALASHRITLQLDRAISSDGFRLAWLKQGYNSFLVLKNTGGVRPDVWVLVPDPRAGGVLSSNQACVVTLEPRSNAFVDYRKPEHWTDGSITAQVAFSAHERDQGGTRAYRVYLANPAFPAPAFAANDPRPIRYGQIGVSAVNSDGLEGSVSTPAPIVAVQRVAPAPLPPSYLEYGTVRATTPDVHGKSTYFYRWKKTGAGLKHFVYRAMDEALYRVDLANNHARDAYVAIAAGLGVDYDVNVHAFTSVDQYRALDPSLLMVVANMPGNERAFTRLHASPIDESDTSYQNRSTETPAVGTPLPAADAGWLLYQDDTLDGRGSNTYFYRLRSVDRAGNLSAFTRTTPPVTIPQVLPAARPALTQVVGEEKQVTLRWAQKAHPGLVGFNVYRSDRADHASDWRRMTLLKTSETSVSTVAGADAREFTDASARARTPYYYGVVALTRDDEGHLVRSEMSQVREARAWDASRPEVTVTVLEAEVDYIRERVSLLWISPHPDYACELRRTPAWVDSEPRTMTYEAAQGGYTFTDAEVDLAVAYQYELTVRTTNGQEAGVKVQATVIP